MVHEKNSRVSLCVQELCHPQDSLWILAAIPVCRNDTGLTVLDHGLRFFWYWILGWISQQLLFWSSRRKQISPLLPFNMFTWHSYWIGIYATQVSPCSSLTVAWHCHGWWGRRAWGRRMMINFLPWRCHGCWRGQAWGRTRWQAWNHDRNEVLRIAFCANPVFTEMWFLTVDPFVWVSVFIAKLSKR